MNSLACKLEDTYPLPDLTQWEPASWPEENVLVAYRRRGQQGSHTQSWLLGFRGTPELVPAQVRFGYTTPAMGYVRVNGLPDDTNGTPAMYRFCPHAYEAANRVEGCNYLRKAGAARLEPEIAPAFSSLVWQRLNRWRANREEE